MFRIMDEHADYLLGWVNELKQQKIAYRQPLLSSPTINFLKHACDTLQQDNHVFIMACEVLEDFVHYKVQQDSPITKKINLLLAVVTLLSKHIGEMSDIRPKCLQTFYHQVLKQTITAEDIKRSEMEIMKTLEYKLPLFTILDDLKLIFRVYIEPVQLRINLLSLCEDILCLLYVNRRDFFVRVKSNYEVSSDAMEAFEGCITNRFYVCVGIILTAIQITQLKNFFDVEKLLRDFSAECQIHPDHFWHLSNQIIQILN